MIYNLTLFFIVASLGLGFINSTDEKYLTLNLNNIKNKGTLYVSICDDEKQWPSKGKYSTILKVETSGTQSFNIKNIPLGTIAIVLFLDVNGNGKLDTNFFGMPSEPYAFSNNMVPHFSAPSFKECSFMFVNSGQQVTMNLN